MFFIYKRAVFVPTQVFSMLSSKTNIYSRNFQISFVCVSRRAFLYTSMFLSTIINPASRFDYIAFLYKINFSLFSLSIDLFISRPLERREDVHSVTYLSKSLKHMYVFASKCVYSFRQSVLDQLSISMRCTLPVLYIYTFGFELEFLPAFPRGSSSKNALLRKTKLNTDVYMFTLLSITLSVPAPVFSRCVSILMLNV